MESLRLFDMIFNLILSSVIQWHDIQPHFIQCHTVTTCSMSNYQSSLQSCQDQCWDPNSDPRLISYETMDPYLSIHAITWYRTMIKTFWNIFSLNVIIHIDFVSFSWIIQNYFQSKYSYIYTSLLTFKRFF